MIFEEYGKQLFELISNHTQLGIAVIDVAGRFLYYNRALEEMEGLETGEMLGKHVLDVFPSSDPQTSTILQCIETGKPTYDNLQTYINFKGKKITSIVTNIPIIVKGEIKGVLEIIYNANRIKQIYESTSNLFEDEEDAGKSRAKRLKNSYYEFDDFKTENKATISLIENVKRMSAYGNNTLIYGETGTGKEIIAQSIHNNGSRKSKPFLAQNCAAMPENLMESILFGTVRGSFTGARDMSGLFEQADGGTLLLDELNSLPVSLQAKLLRVLQEGRVKRLGENIERSVDVHVIATINEPPEKLMEEGRLREDLFFRLSTMYIPIPSLAQRPEDIPMLIDYYTDKYALEFKIKKPEFAPEIKRFFDKYEWRGNVRELMNVVCYALMNQHNSGEIELTNLPHYFQVKFHQQQPKENIEGIEFADEIDFHKRKLILDTLEENSWNVSKAARVLKMKRQTLHNRMKRLGIHRPKKS